jgi:hypothetical protein
MTALSRMRWDELRTRRVSIPDDVVFRALAHETVLLNVGTGTYHMIDEIGARFFEVIRQAPSLEVACDQLSAEYKQPLDRIAGDLAEFCRELAERGLVEVEPSPSA